MFTQSGGMIWQTPGIEMTTNARGGLAKSIGRKLAGESLFIANYTAQADNVKIAFGATVPGCIVPVNVGATPVICQKGSFLCAEQSVQLDVTLTKRIAAGFFGGEGFILQKLSGSGMAFLEIDGSAVDYDLAAGQQLVVDTGKLATMDATCSVDIQSVSGVKNVLFGGNGLFHTVVRGPGRVTLQTMPMSKFAEMLSRFLPKKND